MAFRHLEDSLETENILPYLEFSEQIREPMKTVFRYALDIASYLDSQSLGNQYALFGGYAVLSNLMNAFGDSVAMLWRGSTDLDMTGTMNVLNSLRGGYHITNDKASPNISRKRTLKLDTGQGKECKIDLYTGGFLHKGQARRNHHFGIPLRVLKPEYIVRNKIYTPEDQMHHYGDIISMLSVIEKEEGIPRDVSSVLVGNNEFRELRRRLIVAEQRFSKDRLGIFPSKKFLEELKRKLDKK